MYEETSNAEGHPASSDAQVENHMEIWREQLPDVDRVLGLHPDEYKHLLSILADSDVKLDELHRLPDSTNAFDVERRIYEERTKAISDFLGEAKNNEWIAYLETTGVRAQVKALDQSTPLTEDQRVALLQALIETNKNFQAKKEERERAADGGRLSRAQREAEYKAFSNAMHYAAAPFLSEPQLRAYDKILNSARPSPDEFVPAL